jgi:WD40-like Beta Propeller Repeat
MTSAPEVERTATTPAKSDSNSTHSATINVATTASSVVKASTSATSVGADDVDETGTQPSATDSEPTVAPTAQSLEVNTASSALAVPMADASSALVAPAVQVAAPATGLVGLLNSVVTTLLNPFLAPAPNTPEPVSPVVWAVLGWVRRNLFNQSPTINYNPTTTLQTGQTVTGNIGATDAENDALTYTVTQGPENGTLTIDQATGNFTYTPDDINYEREQVDSFKVTVSDGKFNLLSLFRPHSDQETIEVNVQPPSVERVILNLPEGITHPWTPRFADDGRSIYFTATPPDGSRSELYNVNVDGTNVQCLTCGLSPNITADLFKPVPTADGSGRVLVQVETGLAASAVIFEPAVGDEPARLVPIVPPAVGGYNFPVSPLQEPRISPDGQHILFSRLGAGQNGYFGVVPVVGKLVKRADGSAYDILDSRVVAAAGEGKNWTPDGKGIVCLCGLYETGNVDNVVVDLATGQVTRLNANLDYDEDMDLSPNQQWMAVGSMRTFDALTPLTRIVRSSFLPVFIQGAVYTKYAIPINISNQEWLVAVEDDLEGENGIPLFEFNDDYTARSMPSWNATGDAVTFWEYNIDDPEQTRLVIANLTYTTSVGTVQGDKTTPALSTSFPELSTYRLGPPPMPPVGTYSGAGGGTAVISEVADPARAGHTLRTVTYTNYVNEAGMILNGTESTSTPASQATIYYLADIEVSGAHTGYLSANATINQLQRTITGDITSELDGDVLHLLDQERYEEAVANT